MNHLCVCFEHPVLGLHIAHVFLVALARHRTHQSCYLCRSIFIFSLSRLSDLNSHTFYVPRAPCRGGVALYPLLLGPDQAL
jgi:hypothetical protein